MAQMAKRRIRASRKGHPRFVCASEKRCTGNFGARTGHRFYNPTTGRWLSRDPIVEKGGLNIYGFVSNDPLDRYDHLGLVERIPVEVVKALQKFWNGGAPDCVLDGSPVAELEKAARNAEAAAKRYRDQYPGDAQKEKFAKFQEERAKKLRGYLERRAKLKAKCKIKCKVPGLLLMLPGLLEDADRMRRAIENGKTYEEQLREDLKDIPYLNTPWGVIENPYYNPIVEA